MEEDNVKKKKIIQSTLTKFVRPIIKTSDNLPVFETAAGLIVPVANFGNIKTSCYRETCERLKVAPTCSIGRPTFHENKARKLANEIVHEVKRSNSDIEAVLSSAQFKDRVEELKSVQSEKKPKAVIDAIVVVADEDDEIEELKENIRRTSSVYAELMERSLCHAWGVDGSHIGNYFLTILCLLQ